MTNQQKNEFMEKHMVLIAEYFVVDETEHPQPINAVPTNEMLTVNECVQQFDGLSAITVRKLAARGEISPIRAGEGKKERSL